MSLVKNNFQNYNTLIKNQDMLALFQSVSK